MNEYTVLYGEDRIGYAASCGEKTTAYTAIRGTEENRICGILLI